MVCIPVAFGKDRTYRKCFCQYFGHISELNSGNMHLSVGIGSVLKGLLTLTLLRGGGLLTGSTREVGLLTVTLMGEVGILICTLLGGGDPARGMEMGILTGALLGEVRVLTMVMWGF